MKKQFDIKKLVLLNLPYLLMGLFATNFGEAWRLAQGTNASEKFLSLFAVLPGACLLYTSFMYTQVRSTIRPLRSRKF